MAQLEERLFSIHLVASSNLVVPFSGICGVSGKHTAMSRLKGEFESRRERFNRRRGGIGIRGVPKNRWRKPLQVRILPPPPLWDAFGAAGYYNCGVR